MKKIITFCFFSICAFAGQAQFTVGSGDTLYSTGTTSPSVEYISSGSCRNTGVDTINLQWKIVSDTGVAAWSYTGFCDKNLCYPFTIGESRVFTLAPNASSIIELHISTGCNPGNGTVKFLLWNTADSAASVQLVDIDVNLTQGASCSAGISEVATAQVSIYPNPVSNELTVSLPQTLDNGQLDIYNLIGSKVYSQPLSATKGFDVSGLETGIYVARISDGSRIVATKKFTKE